MTLSVNAQRSLVYNLMLKHPLPWHIEFGWTAEVVDACGATVIKCMHADEAGEIVTLASELDVALKQAREEFEDMIDDGDF